MKYGSDIFIICVYEWWMNASTRVGDITAYIMSYYYVAYYLAIDLQGVFEKVVKKWKKVGFI